MAQAKKLQKVVVIARTPGTNWARVLFGTLESQEGETAVLRDARQALYYGRESGGELGLAHVGPRGGSNGDSRVTATVPRVIVPAGVGIVMECTPAAIEAWEKAPVYEGKGRV